MRRRASATALLVALVSALSACESAPRDGRPVAVDGQAATQGSAEAVVGDGRSFEGAEWVGWTGVYADVRPATEEAVAELVQRVEDLNDTSWTGVESSTGAEVAFTPTHARVTKGPVAVHADPAAEDLVDMLLTVCVAGEDCRSFEELEDDESAAGLVTQVGPVLMGLLETQQLDVQDVEDLLDEGGTALATVASPVGDLDCLAHAIDDEDTGGLEGSELVIGRGSMEEAFASLCVDARGLVVSGPSGSSGILYASWRPGVDGDVAELVPPTAVASEVPAPGAELDDVFWGTWDPVYTDVRPATAADVDALRDRAAALGRQEWTLVDATYGTEIAYTPERVRIRIVDLMDAYVDPFDTAEPWQLVICGDGKCVDSRRLARADAPHLTSSFTDAMIFIGVATARTQARPQLEILEHAALATVESPVGLLECLVNGERAADVATQALEGADVVVDPGQRADPEEGASLFTQCVDSRGLLVVGGASFTPVLQVQSWHEGVEGDLAYPYPVKR